MHDQWTPVQERIKDFIAQPKSNGYQSLHTTVFGPGRQLYEIQIRTRDMHRTADFGIAAHWRYKEDAPSDELDRHLTWFRQVLELQMDAKTPDEILEFLSGKVAKWWLPDDIVFIDAVPKTSVGKFNKRALREQFKNYELTAPAEGAAV